MPQEKLKTAVIGCGHFGRFHAEKYARLPASQLVAVVDANPTQAAAVAKAVRAEALSDHRQLFGRVDAVSIAVPTVAHFEVARDCLEAGLHVLVEKPFTETLEQADALVALAAARGLTLQVGHLQRFFLERLKIADLIDDPLYVECYRIAPFRPRGTDVSVVLDLMIHDIDLILALVRSEVTDVDAAGAPVVSGEPDICNTRLRFANGGIANITASRVSLKTERKMRIFQRDAYFSIDLHNRKVVVMRKNASGKSWLPGLPPISRDERSYTEGDDLMAEIEDFLAAIREGRPPLVSGEDGRRALAAALRITESLDANLKLVERRL